MYHIIDKFLIEIYFLSWLLKLDLECLLKYSNKWQFVIQHIVF